MLDAVRRWRERRRLLRRAAELEATARRREASGGAYAIAAVAAAVFGSTTIRDFASGAAQRYREETAAIRARARSMREEAARR